MHHQAHAAADFRRQGFRLRESRRERLLAQHVDAIGGGEPREPDVRLAPRRNVHRVELFIDQHLRGIRINSGKRELRGAREGARFIAIAHGNHFGARVLLPSGEMIAGNIAGTDQADAQLRARGAPHLSVPSRR